jgi:hypothetical protein
VPNAPGVAGCKNSHCMKSVAGSLPVLLFGNPVDQPPFDRMLSRCLGPHDHF